ncbi:MAG: hypothetical protein AAF642_18785, partial [Pseudomonadota bacterium]
AILCLGGPARLLVDAARMKARAAGASARDFRISIGLTVSVLLPFAIFAQHGLAATAIISISCATVFALAVTQISLRAATPQAIQTMGATS